MQLFFKKTFKNFLKFHLFEIMIHASYKRDCFSPILETQELNLEPGLNPSYTNAILKYSWGSLKSVKSLLPGRISCSQKNGLYSTGNIPHVHTGSAAESIQRTYHGITLNIKLFVYLHIFFYY